MTARKARESDLGQAMRPIDDERPPWNGDGHEVIEVGPQVAEPRVSSPFPPIALSATCTTSAAKVSPPT